MARSQQTFNKKENEKKKLQKRKEKEEKKLERQQNSDKGKGLADMLMYVDHEGNLSTTPPDPRNKPKIEAEQISVSVSRQADVDPADNIREGIVSFFNTAKGYGFIRDLASQESIFVHANALLEPISDGNRVVFETEHGPKGLQAVQVKKQ
jgi:cold shock CspA family protein